MLETPLSDESSSFMSTKVELFDNNSFWTDSPFDKQTDIIPPLDMSTLAIGDTSKSTTSSSPPPTQTSLSAQNTHSDSTGDQLLDHSHLKPGEKASLLSYAKTINMYRENARKTNNMDVQCDFAIFLVEAAKRLQASTQPALSFSASSNSSESTLEGDAFRVVTTDDNKQQQEQRQAYILEAEKLLKQVAMRGHSEAQYYLANMYAAGLLNNKTAGKPDYEKAFTLFVQSAKHHHSDAAYRAAKCYEDGLGTKRDKGKAVQYYRKAAALNHPGAMYRLGLAEMKGELNLTRNARNGFKWLKRSAEAATHQYPHALHELAMLHERGLDSIVFVDHDYAITLYHEAVAFGYAPSAYRLGECYEFGKLNCSINPQLSIQYYRMAAEQRHPEACFALTAWYLVGVPNVIPASDEQAYAWAMAAAQQRLPRAEYAVGYFFEMGIGTVRDERMAMAWYRRAADHGERRAIERLLMYAPTLPVMTDGKSRHPLPISLSASTLTLKKLSGSNKEWSGSINRSISASILSKRMSFMSVSHSITNLKRQDSSASVFRKATSFFKKPLQQHTCNSNTTTLKEEEEDEDEEKPNV
ncbi:MAG: hypothetical protein EXX96DRAFT_650755 [Benjaminiella poitrasii]|nr:MAG: hypothetical protein EXX96DRAFT_650755 [Benjaminiella poitrasii]